VDFAWIFVLVDFFTCKKGLSVCTESPKKYDFLIKNEEFSYLEASSIATATATVIPTMGLLPAPMRPIIST